jgi:prolipoprotein diacylglyceryl transferase
VGLFASIPSPSSGIIELGPLTIHMYGLMLLAGIGAAIWLTGRRWAARGGDWDLIFRLAVWGVSFGVVGARAYHVATSWNELPSPKWQGVFEVWKGGLGVWGGIGLGVIVGAIVARRAGASVRGLMDAVAPGLLLAQGIGRLGNWWNQELFGRPTDLPWGLKIDPANRPDRYLDSTTFHPTFLYELVYDSLAVCVLLWLDRRFRFKAPALFALYVAAYCAFRFYTEWLRIDPAHVIGPLRLNGWVSIAGFLVSTGFFVWWQLLRGRRTGGGAGPRPAMAIPKGRVRPRR